LTRKEKKIAKKEEKQAKKIESEMQSAQEFGMANLKSFGIISKYFLGKNIKVPIHTIKSPPANLLARQIDTGI
jgi:hypothetical protein